MFIYKKEIKSINDNEKHVYVVRTVSLYKSIFNKMKNRLVRSKKGECTISGLANKSDPDYLSTEFTSSLTISIDEEYQGEGYSKKMWSFMIKNIERECPEINNEKMFFIDGDGSDGYWDHIGCKINRYGYDYLGLRELEGKGYEKSITLCKLKGFCKK